MLEYRFHRPIRQLERAASLLASRKIASQAIFNLFTFRQFVSVLNEILSRFQSLQEQTIGRRQKRKKVNRIFHLDILQDYSSAVTAEDRRESRRYIYKRGRNERGMLKIRKAGKLVSPEMEHRSGQIQARLALEAEA